MTNSLETLFHDVDGAQRTTPTHSHLMFVIEVDKEGNPVGYGVYGDVFDHETQEFFPVAEYSPKFNRAMHTLNYYKYYFNVTDILSTTRPQF